MINRLNQRLYRLRLERLESRRVLAPLIDVGVHTLLPDTPDQELPIYVSGGDPVAGAVEPEVRPARQS